MSKNSILTPTSHLRWVGVNENKRLQQYWTDPLEVSGEGEWRNVPRILSEDKPNFRSNHLDDLDVVHL